MNLSTGDFLVQVESETSLELIHKGFTRQGGVTVMDHGFTMDLLVRPDSYWTVASLSGGSRLACSFVNQIFKILCEC